MTGDLRGVRLKISRANENLTLLHNLAQTFVENRSVIGEFDPQTSDYVFRVGGEPPPLGWGVLVGEVVHNLRSALDNLLWQLVISRGKRPSTQTQFPIYEHVTVKKRKPEGIVAVPVADEVARLVQGVRKEDRAFIEAAQPYHDGECATRHPLALLGYLNNFDKHRIVQPFFSCLTVDIPGEPPLPIYDGVMPFLQRALNRGASTRHVQGFSVMPILNEDAGEDRGVELNSGLRRNDRTEIMRVHLAPTGPNPKVEMNPRPTLTVAVGDTERPVLFSDLWAIGSRVQEIHDRFRPVVER